MTDKASLITYIVVVLVGLLILLLCDHLLPSYFILLEPLLIHNIIMPKSHLSKVNTTQLSSQFQLPSPLKTKLRHSNRQTTTPRSLSDSTMSLPPSFYNDHNRIYANKSKAIVQKNSSFQSRPLSLYHRKKYDSDQTEQIVTRRDRMKSQNCAQSMKKSSSQVALERFHKVAANKYKKLLYGQQIVKINRALLEKGIKRSASERQINNKKWGSPFRGESRSQKLRDKPLLPQQLEPLLPRGDPNHLKVLNLDRLFRVKEGKLTNVVPLPVAKLSLVSSRQYMLKAVKHQDKIHQAIRQYNTLLRICQLQKTKPRLGIKGKNFTKTPTIQQLMGLKLAPSKTLKADGSTLLEPQIFTKHCKYFKLCVKQDVHISRRVLAGLAQSQANGYLSLPAFTLFWQLFISRTARPQDKIQFLLYFLLPQGQEKVELPVIRLILELMCQQLPPLEKLDLSSEVLSQEEKSKIFLEALIRVLFGQDSTSKTITRNYLREVLSTNPDACDLLVRLMQIENDV